MKDTKLNLPTPAELERLALLIEECAEVQQIATKIIRHGYGSYNPFDELKTTNRRLLQKELGDLLYALEMMTQSADVEDHMIQVYKSSKQDKIAPYLHFNTPVDF